MHSEPSFGSSARAELAAACARLVADGGLDYAQARRRALRELYGERGQAPRDAMPSDEEIDEALREHLALFDDEHAPRLARMRRAALALMDRLAPMTVYATGAVWKGIAAAHVPIHLQVFHDNGKEVAFALLDAGIDVEPAEVTHFAGRGSVEALTFQWRDEPFVVALYDSHDLRGALRPRDGRRERGDRAALAALAAGPAADPQADGSAAR